MAVDQSRPTTDQSTPSDSIDPDANFGHYLKKQRLQHQLSLTDISASSGISMENLQALEDGDRRKLPADVFVRGFIRLYAKQLEINPQAVLKKYEDEWGNADGVYDPARYINGEFMAKSAPFYANKQFLILFFTVVFVAAGYFTYKIFTPSERIQEPAIKLAQPAVQIEAAAEKASSSADQSLSAATQLQVSPLSPGLVVNPTPLAEEPPPPLPETAATKIIDEEKVVQSSNSSSKPDGRLQTTVSSGKENNKDSTEVPAAYILSAVFTEETWLRVTIDGTAPLEFIFKPGEKHLWKAQEKIRLFIGNAGGIHLTINGSPVTINKKSGQTLSLILP